MSWETMPDKEKDGLIMGLDFVEEKEELESLMYLRNYEDLPAHFEKHKKFFNKWRQSQLINQLSHGTGITQTDSLIDEDWALRQATKFLAGVLEQKVTILKRVSNLYRKNELELLELDDRRNIILDKISYRTLEHRPLCGGFKYLVQYPIYLLNVKRLINFYSEQEIEYMKKWGLASMPVWLNKKQFNPLYIEKKHSSGTILQYLGEDGSYRSHNDRELDLIHRFEFNV